VANRQQCVATYRGTLPLARIICRRVRSAADMQMAQIAQRSAVFFAHPPSKIWVPQMLIARELRHVLKNSQALLNRFLSLRRQIAPVRQHIIFNVIALLGSHLLPHSLAVAHVLLLLRRQLPKASLILEHPLSILGAEPLWLPICVGTVIVLSASGILPIPWILVRWRVVGVRSLIAARRAIGVGRLMIPRTPIGIHRLMSCITR
jgi:hypothetical protein